MGSGRPRVGPVRAAGTRARGVPRLGCTRRGYAAVDWLPGAIFVLGLAFVVALGEWPPFAGRPRLAVAALFLAGFTAWSFLTIASADFKGDAWDGANRTLPYLCVFVLFAWRPIPARVVTVLLGGFVAVTAAIGAVDFLRAVGADHIEGFFVQGRLVLGGPRVGSSGSGLAGR
jgi:hypothetical protein